MPSQERQPAASLTPGDLEPILGDLSETHAAIGRAFPGDPESRQPVHTVYGGAHLFRSDTPQKLGEPRDSGARHLCARTRGSWRPRWGCRIRPMRTGVTWRPSGRASRPSCGREPVEDFRIDFEDGYGHRPAAEEDGHSASAASAVAAAAGQGTLPPFIGIRIKPLSKDLHERGLRTLDLFVTTLAAQAGSSFPSRLLVTLPKIVAPGQVTAAARACALLERRLGAASRDAAAGADDRDAAIDRLRRRDVAAARVRHRRRRPGHRRALRRLRLHRALRHHGRVAGRAPSRLRLRAAHDPGVARPDRGASLGQRHHAAAGADPSCSPAIGR